MTALGAVVTPALQGIMSSAASDDQQGELQGGLTALNAIAIILAQQVMTQVFARFTDDVGIFLPGAPFLLSLGLVFITLIIFIFCRRSGVAAEAKTPP